MHLYEREINGLVIPTGTQRMLFPIGFPPTGRLMRVAVQSAPNADGSNPKSSGNDIFTCRVYDRNWAVKVPVLAYAPTGSPVSAATFTVAASSLPANLYTPNWPDNAHFFADVLWSYGGMFQTKAPTNPNEPGYPYQQGAPIYPGQQYISPHIKFNVQSGTTLTTSVLSNQTAQTPSLKTSILPLPTAPAAVNPGSMFIYYMPVAGTASYPSRSAIVVDETMSANIAQLTSTDTCACVMWSDGHGMPYQNREGTFTVPVRQLYLEFDYASNGASATSTYTFNVELACELGGEAN